MNDVIVIGSNYSTALGTVRAVGMAGFGVRLLATTKECADIIGNSRYIVKTITCRNEFQSIYNAMEKLRAAESYIPVIPTSDLATLLLDKHADELRNHYCFPNINHTQGEISKWMDKLKQKQLAQSCGLAVAEGKAYSANNEGIKVALSEVDYPCITKAISSEDCVSSKDLCSVCRDSYELEKVMHMACVKQCSYVLVEQLLEIEEEYAVYGLAFNGKVVMPACVDTWRSGHGAHKGVTAEGIMRNANFLNEDKIKLENFVRKCGLNGLFCIDVIHSKGRYYFVEMNLRYGASGFAATIGGANLPGMLANLMSHGGELDETVQLLNEPQFLNEKVDLDDFRVGFMSWKEYKQHQRGDKVCFMKSDDDSEPWKQFKKLEVRKHLARILRGKKRRN